MANVFLKTIQCKRCDKVFYICSSCWRGQAYCSTCCRGAARRETHRKAQRKYRQTEKGKAAHRRQEKRRRLKKSKKTMDDPPSTPTQPDDNLRIKSPDFHPCCCFCGKSGPIVAQFPRRGYGKRKIVGQLSSTYV